MTYVMTGKRGFIFELNDNENRPFFANSDLIGQNIDVTNILT